ncbi:hypothetical protein [Niabella drilacis]|uniref:Uncharacterized protein n=1 Tax=Niabella drilacis (strain DSM 25811 / CCM 8410 / CCUG 62505 / LMG 26954 / E90) TaxID=1285928 RepID=A0A1G6SFR3_NIADE|nr:hypothetical protein [Niabella drilacis]SDD15732.1 hypothetical protein SAMN04487894_106213 [Niabella drilacis]
MKKAFILLLLTAVFSCKKETPPKTGEIMVFKKRLSEIDINNDYKKHFVYNADGRITACNSLSNTTYGQGNAFFIKYVQNGTSDVYEMKNTTRNAQGKIASSERYYNGQLTTKIQYTYNSEGFLTRIIFKRTDINYDAENNYYYENGNMVKLVQIKNGVQDNTYRYEYDLQAPNPFKLDWYEVMENGFITDDQFGTLNKNLPKRQIREDKNGQTGSEIQFHFTRDADGYPLSAEEKTKDHTTLYSFKFE